MKYPDMSSYIRQLQRARSLSLQDLSRMLGYSSSTSLTRLMQASANRASLQQFSDKLHACEALQLTRQESNLLDDLIELHDIGPAFREMLALRRLLRCEPVETVPLQLYDSEGTPTSFLAHFAPMNITRMVLINIEQVGLYGELALLMENGDFPVIQLVYTDGRPLHIINTLRGTMPVLFSPRYTAYTHPINFEESITARGLITSDVLICEHLMSDGSYATEAIVFTARDRGEIIHLNSPLDFLMRLLPSQSHMVPVLKHVSGACLKTYNYICADLERDRMVCRIRPDLSLVHIPYPLLVDAFCDHASQEAKESYQMMDEIFLQRQKNMMEKHAHEYSIMRRGVMRRFAATGKLSDHMWCCRPFTMRERIQILRHVRYTLMALPHLHFVFLKDDDALKCDEIIFYEDKGLSFLKNRTDYGRDSAQYEVFVEQMDLLHVFKRFIMQSTLRYRVDTQKDAAAFFDDLIAQCEASLQDSSTDVEA